MMIWHGALLSELEYIARIGFECLTGHHMMEIVECVKRNNCFERRTFVERRIR